MPTIPPFFLMDQKNLFYQLYKSWKFFERRRAENLTINKQKLFGLEYARKVMWSYALKNNLKWIKERLWETLVANCADKLAKISNCMASWELRRLTLLGKITALKSLIVPQLVYILSPLPTNQKVLEELNTWFFEFSFYGAIWSNGI